MCPREDSRADERQRALGANLPQDVTDAQDMYVAALAAAKKEEPVRDTPEAIRSYYELAKYYGKDSFLEMLLGFLIGDGGAYMRSWGYVIGLYQSHRAFLVGWSQALDYYGFGALSITSSPIAESVVGNRVVTSTRMAYRAQVNGEAACRELARALVAAAERRGLLFVEKVRTLQMMRDRPFSQEVCATGTRRSPTKRPRRRRTGIKCCFYLKKKVVVAC